MLRQLEMRRYEGRKAQKPDVRDPRKRVSLAETYFATCYENLTRGRINSTVAKIVRRRFEQVRALTKIPNVRDGVWEMLLHIPCRIRSRGGER